MSLPCIKRDVISISSINNCIYILDTDDEIYKIFDTQVESTFLYCKTLDAEIPQNQYSFEEVIYGVAGRDILRFNSTDNSWQRIGTVDFYINGFYILNSTEAVLWDGDVNFLYSLVNGRIKKYEYNHPLTDFLDSDITEVFIAGVYAHGYDAIHGLRYNEIIYKKNGNELQTNKYKDAEAGEFWKKRKNRKKIYKNHFSIDTLASILNSINKAPYFIPLIKELNFNEKDLIFNSKNIELMDEDISKSDFNKAVDTLKYFLDIPINEVVMMDGASSSGMIEEWISVGIVNENQDTLIISKDYNYAPEPFHLPWSIDFNRVHFTSYDIEFSKFINGILPENFRGKEFFDNNMFIIRLAEYLQK